MSDRTFGPEVIHRVDADCDARVFAPAIEQARQDGKSYQEIRDAIRKEWKPAP